MNSPQNVEDNVETPLLLQDLDGKTSLWQHDNPWIRLPAQFVRWIWQLLIFLIVSVHPIFFSVLLTVGIFLSISLSRGGFPVVLLMVEAFTAIAWAIYSGISRS